MAWPADVESELGAERFALVISLLDLDRVPILVFQPEVRRALMRLDRSLLRVRNPGAADPGRALSDGAFEMAATRTGALIIVTRQDAVDELITGGVMLAHKASREARIAV